MKHLPAPLPRRRLLGAARTDRAPIGRMLQQIRGDIALRFGDLLILRHEARDRLPRIAALGQKLLGGCDIALALQDLAARFSVERRTRREETRQRLPERGVIPDQRAHVVFLAEGREHGTSRLHIVEGRVQVVHPEHTDVAERVGDVDTDVAVLLEHRHEIGDRILPPIDLPVLQRGRRRGRIRHHHPFHAVDQHLLAAGEPGRLLLPRRVIGKLLEHRLGAGHPLALRELHWARADIFGDLLEWVGLGDTLRHDEGAGRAVLAQRQKHLRIRLLQRPSEGLVVDCCELVLDRLDHQPHGIAGRPTRQARHHVLAQHRLAVVELQPRSQAKGPAQTVIGPLLGLDHLALRLQRGVEAVEGIPHQRGGVAHHILGPPHRIEIREVGLGHEAQGARRSALGKGRHRKAARRRQAAYPGQSFQQRPAIHRTLPVSSCYSGCAHFIRQGLGAR